MKKKNGFTLVELLAVIVVLAIIMIIAIPNVLDSMNQARKRSFVLEGQKFIKDVKTVYTTDSGLGGDISGPGVYVYELSREDVGYDEHGSYNGFVVVNAAGEKITDPQYFLFMYDDNYEILEQNYSEFGLPESDIKAVTPEAKKITAETVCASIIAQEENVTNCYNRKGYIIEAKNSGNSVNQPDDGADYSNHNMAQ